MLKKIAKRITWEVNQAEDYVEQAYLVKAKCPELADLFIDLGKEEIDHAKKLFKKGADYVDNKRSVSFDGEAIDNDKQSIIWEWEHRIMMDKISELEYKIAMYRR